MTNPQTSQSPKTISDFGHLRATRIGASVIAETGTVMAHINGAGEERKALADLFAAAPELLAALKKMVAWTSHAFDAEESTDLPNDLPELFEAMTAIAKAEGQIPPTSDARDEEVLGRDFAKKNGLQA